jgi:hypothetical protein
MGTVDKLGFNRYSTFGGYQDIDGDSDTRFEVEAQILSVCGVFQQHNVKYSNAITTSPVNDFVFTQYVRTLEESYGNAQANCVDGSVLFASVLRRIGIEPFLVLIPGHMFLGYFVDKNRETRGFLETTMLGGIARNANASLDSFLAAAAEGEREYEAAIEFFDDPEKNDYQLISIADCRYLGVVPISRY